MADCSEPPKPEGTSRDSDAGRRQASTRHLNTGERPQAADARHGIRRWVLARLDQQLLGRRRDGVQS